MICHILNRMPIRPRIIISLFFLLELLNPSWSEAGKITSPANADALRAVSTASSSPLSNTAIRDVLNTGLPVSETSTTTLSDGATQTADLLIVPNTSTGTGTITKNIHLADGDLEKVVDVATISGDRTTHTVTTTLPDGSIQTKDETDVTEGDKTIIKGTVSTSGGGPQTISGVNIQRGTGSVTDETVTNPAGRVYHDRIVITLTGPLSQSETNTTRGPDGSISMVKSITSTVLDPLTVGQDATAATIPPPPPVTAAQALHLEAQYLAPPAAAGNAAPTVLPTPAPEPSTLAFFAVVLGAAWLRHGFSTRRR
jgi:uncharacterized protein YaiI (UPF0178 family)